MRLKNDLKNDCICEKQMQLPMETQVKRRKRVLQDYQQLAEIKNSKYLLNVIPQNTMTSIPGMWECNKGHVFSSSFNNFSKPERGCPKCAGKMRITLDDYHQAAFQKGYKYLLEEIPETGQKKFKKDMWECSDGHRWSAAYNHINIDTGCPHCAGNAILKLEDYKAAAEKRGFKYLLDKIPKTNKLKLNEPMWECQKGHQWSAVFPTISRNIGGCPICAGNMRKTLEDYKKIGRENEIEYLLDHIPNSIHVKLDEPMWKCKKGHVWSTMYGHIQQGHGCPTCDESQGEKKIRKYLDLNKIQYIYQYKFKDIKTRPYDFFLPEKNLLIEYDGEQHFQEVPFFSRRSLQEQEAIDKAKTQLALDRGYRLCRISYVHFKDVEEILEEVIKSDANYTEKY